MKEKCVAKECGKRLEMTIDRYDADGNYCKRCINSTAQRLRERSLALREEHEIIKRQQANSTTDS